MAGPWTLLRLLRQTDFLPYCTQSRLFLADILPPKAEGCHHFSPKREKDAAFTAAGGTIWPLLELSMSQAPAPCIAPPSTSSCLHTAEKHFLILLFHCPTVFSLMLTVHLLHVYAYDRDNCYKGREEESPLAFRGWEVLLRGFCPFEEQLGGKEWTHTGDQD